MKTHKLINILIALVWFVNGLFCKILNLAPRHQEIVARILGNDYSKFLTITIGGFEILMTIWVLSRYKYKINALAQITIVITMNIIEFILASDLLLWGKVNIIFAILFSYLVYYNNFKINN